MLLGALVFLLSACQVPGIPSAQHPSCSWDSNVPSNGAALCRQSFLLVSALARAVQRGDTHTLDRLIVNPTVRHHVAVYSAAARRDGLRDLHVVPTLALRTVAPGTVGAAFYLAGESRSGRVSLPETLYLRERRGALVVIMDQPGQEW